jgi:hydrogenase maturation protease
MNASPRVLVAGLGNVLLGDDGFGCEVARRLVATQVWPETVRIADFGIRGVHLALELIGEQYDLAIFIDAAPRGERPGTVYVIEPILAATPDGSALHIAGSGVSGQVDGHNMTPDAVLGWLSKLGGVPPRVVVVGCEPAKIEDGIGLSDAVSNAVGTAVTTVSDIIRGTAHVSGNTGTDRRAH